MYELEKSSKKIGEKMDSYKSAPTRILHPSVSPSDTSE